MPMYNLIESNGNYSKRSGSLSKYYKADPNANLADYGSFRPKIKLIGSIPDDGNTTNVETAGSLKYLINFWRTLEVPVISCEINLILKQSSACVIINQTGAGTLAITDTKCIVPIVILSIPDD